MRPEDPVRRTQGVGDPNRYRLLTDAQVNRAPDEPVATPGGEVLLRHADPQHRAKLPPEHLRVTALDVDEPVILARLPQIAEPVSGHDGQAP
jgi:hypothetical protein